MSELLTTLGLTRKRIKPTLCRISYRLSATFALLYAIQVSGIFDVNSIIELNLFLLLTILSLILTLLLHFSWNQVVDQLTKLRYVSVLKHDSRQD